MEGADRGVERKPLLKALMKRELIGETEEEGSGDRKAAVAAMKAVVR